MSVGTSVRILTLPPSTVATTVKILTLPSSKARTGSKFWRYLRPRTQTGSKFWRYLRPRTRVGSKFWRYLRPGRKQVQNFDATCDHCRIVEGFKVVECCQCENVANRGNGQDQFPKNWNTEKLPKSPQFARIFCLKHNSQLRIQVSQLNSHLRNYGVKK